MLKQCGDPIVDAITNRRSIHQARTAPDLTFAFSNRTSTALKLPRGISNILQQIHNLRLIPVLEFEPGRFQTQAYEYPHGTAGEYPHEWHCYWKNSLADAGIYDLEPHTVASWLVEVAKLTPEIMAIYLNKVEAIDPENNEAGSLAGGYILQANEIEIAPQCCGSLADIAEWEMAANCQKTMATMLWIGHPSLLVTKIDDRYILIADDDECQIKIDRQELKIAIVNARQQLDDFDRMLLPAVLTAYPHLTSTLALKIIDELIFG